MAASAARCVTTSSRKSRGSRKRDASTEVITAGDFVDPAVPGTYNVVYKCEGEEMHRTVIVEDKFEVTGVMTLAGFSERGFGTHFKHVRLT